MGLNVYLDIEQHETGIFYKKNGKIIEMSLNEWKEINPDKELICKKFEKNNVFSGGLTHNLGEMADFANIYEIVWRPEELNIEYANQLIPLLKNGLYVLIHEKESLLKYNPENSWGSYDQLLQFVTEYLDACIKYPTAKIVISR